MRTVTIEYSKKGFLIQDDEQFVDVELWDDVAIFVSDLHGDEHAAYGSYPKDKAMTEALILMGVLDRD